MKKRDHFTIDMFDEPPKPVTSPGGLACRSEIGHAMSEALKSHDRYDIASKMSQLLGRDISKNMLDAYTAESREGHTPPMDTAIAFDLATGSNVLTELAANKIGARLSVGKEVLYTRLGKLQRRHDEDAKEMKQLRRVIGEHK